MTPVAEFVRSIKTLKEREDMIFAFGMLGDTDPVSVGLDGPEPILEHSCESGNDYLMLGAHIKAGFRLRRRLDALPATRSLDVPDGGAILDEYGKILHACDGASTAQIENLRSGRTGPQAWTFAKRRALARLPGMPDEKDKSVAPVIDLPEGARMTHLGPDLAVIDFPLPCANLPAALTNAEQEVALLVFQGATDEQIAARRGASAKMVGNQLGSIFRKLGVSSRAELVLRLRRAPGADD